jgi:ferredoxin
MAVNTLVRNPNFAVSKHDSDLCDGQQLCYLVSSDIVFVTNDSDFTTRTRKSPQAARIKTFAGLLACAEDNLPLL